MIQKRGLFILIGIFILSSVLFYFLIIGKSCNNIECFERSVDKCSVTRFNKVNNGNIFFYKIKLSLGNTCNFKVKIKNLDINTPQDLATLFEDKEMSCKVPKSIFNSEFIKFENSIDYCTGPLKEAMYELIIRRMYDLSVKQLGNVVLEIEETLEEAR